MAIFRKNTIFHAEEAMPDPDDLKLRFRRRVLLLAFVGFLVILGFPVLKSLALPLHLRHETRKFAEVLLESRLLASKNRTALTLGLSSDSEFWQREFHAKNSSCSGDVMGPSEKWTSSGLYWQFHLQKENGETLAGHTLCLNPLEGLMLDSTPLGEGKLLVSVKSMADSQEVAHLIVSNHGADIQTIID